MKDKRVTTLGVFTIFFCTALVVGNVISSKRIPTGLSVFGNTINISAGVYCYMITYLMSDVISEIYGAKEATRTVIYGMIAQLSATILIVLSAHLDYTDESFQNAFILVLGQNYVTVIATYIAYIVSQTVEIYLFYKIRDYFINKYNDTRHKWIWNNASSAVANLLDSLLISLIINLVNSNWYISLALILRVSRVVTEQYIFKMFISLCDTPFFYFLTRDSKKVKTDG